MSRSNLSRAAAVSRAVSTVSNRAFPIPSVSFSGGAFLGVYHLGAAECLLKHGLLLRPGEVPPRNNDTRVKNEEHPTAAAAAAAAALAGDEKRARRRMPSWGGNKTGPPILTGVSAGSIVSAALTAGVKPEDGMSVIFETMRRTREHGGFMEILRPRFSLVDQVEDLLLREFKRALGGNPEGDFDDYDNDLFLRRMKGGQLLRIGLTDKRKLKFPPIPSQNVNNGNEEAYCYVDQYRNVDDVVATCILSSYIPVFTGPALGAKCPHNKAVCRSWERMRQLIALGCVKNGMTGKPIGFDLEEGQSAVDPSKDSDGAQNEKIPDIKGEFMLDGGLVDAWPVIDDSTLVVSPLVGFYEPNPSISPLVRTDVDTSELSDAQPTESETSSSSASSAHQFFSGKGDDAVRRFYLRLLPFSIRTTKRVVIELNRQNARAFQQMVFCSDDSILEMKFQEGFNDAKRFLGQNNLLRVFSG